MENTTDQIIVDILNERNSRKKKIMRAFSKGRTNHIKSFAILTAENPMGVEKPKDENKRLNAQLKEHLRVGHFPYLPVKGWFGTEENSFLLYNLSFNDAKRIAGLYDQLSFIYGRITGEDEQGVTLEAGYWERPKPKNVEFELVKEVNRYIKVDPSADKDFFTQICKAFRFRLPFFEDTEVKTEFTEDEEEWFAQSLDDTYAGSHRYRCRCKLYGKK